MLSTYGMDALKGTDGKVPKARRLDGKDARAGAELKHDVDMLLENVYREIDKINRRLDNLERKVGNRD